MTRKAILSILFVILMFSFASSQSEFDGDKLISYVNEPFNSEKGKKLQDWYNLRLLVASNYYSPGKNFNLNLIDINGVHTIDWIEIRDTMPEHPIFGKFNAPLPLKLRWGMTRQEIIAKIDSSHEVHYDHTLYYHYDRNTDIVLNFKDDNGNNDFRLYGMIIKKAYNFENYANADPKLKPFIRNPETYKYIIPLKKSANNPAINTTPFASAGDFCSVIQILLTDVSSGFSSHNKIKQWSDKRWQLENKIPGALFTEMVEYNYPVNNKKVYSCHVRMKDNITQGPEANKALDDLKNKITACLPGYTIKEAGLSAFTDDPDQLIGYSWRSGISKPYIEIERQLTSTGKASIFIIVKPL